MAACGDEPVALPPAVQALVDVGKQSRWMTEGDDLWEVFICHVPADTQSSVYAGLPLRRDFTAGDIATVLDRNVGAYFDVLSYGRYRPRFSAGGDVSIPAADEPQACVDAAIA